MNVKENVMYVINPSIDIYFDRESISILSDKAFNIKYSKLWIRELIEIMKDGGCELYQYKEKLSLENQEDFEKIINYFTEKGFFCKKQDNPYADQVLERQFEYWRAIGLDPKKCQKSIQSACVCIVGLGGVGSIVLQHLVGVGLKSYILVDFDYVEPSNLNRQFIYSESNLGELKVNAAGDYILGRLPDSFVSRHPLKIEKKSDIDIAVKHKFPDVIVVAADQNLPDVVYCVAQCVGEGKGSSFIKGGCGVELIEWGPFITSESVEKYLESHRRYAISHKHKDRPILAASNAVNTMLGAVVFKDVISFLVGRTPLSLNKLCQIDIDSWKLDVLKL